MKPFIHRLIFLILLKNFIYPAMSSPTPIQYLFQWNRYFTLILLAIQAYQYQKRLISKQISKPPLPIL